MKIIINNLLILYKHTLDIKCDNSSVSSPVLAGHGVIKDISDWHRKSLNLLLKIRTEEEDHLFEMDTGDWVLVAAPGLDKSPGTQPRASGSQQMRRVHGRASIRISPGVPFPAVGQAQESPVGETWQNLPRGHCSVLPVPLEAAEGALGHSQPLISAVLRRDWQQLRCTGGECEVQTKLGAGQCLASPLLGVCWGGRENASSGAAAQWPQNCSSSSTGRVDWEGSTSPDTQELGLSPCLLSQHLGLCLCTCPAPAPSQAALQGETKGIECEVQEVKGCKRSPGVRTHQSLHQEDTRDGTG